MGLRPTKGDEDARGRCRGINKLRRVFNRAAPKVSQKAPGFPQSGSAGGAVDFAHAALPEQIDDAAAAVRSSFRSIIYGVYSGSGGG